MAYPFFISSFLADQKLKIAVHLGLSAAAKCSRFFASLFVQEDKAVRVFIRLILSCCLEIYSVQSTLESGLVVSSKSLLSLLLSIALLFLSYFANSSAEAYWPPCNPRVAKALPIADVSQFSIAAAVFIFRLSPFSKWPTPLISSA